MATPTKRHKRKKGKDDFSQELLLLGDCVLSALWVAVSSLFFEISEALQHLSGLEELVLVTAVTVGALAVFAPLSAAFGGALWNPVHNAAMLASGKGTAKLHLARMACQILGALAGSYAAVSLLPEWLTDHFPRLPPGVREGVPLAIGFGVEVLFGLVLNLVVLFTLDTQHKRLAYYLPLVLTVLLSFAGASFTGPCLNPAVAFSWWHHYPVHSVVEHVAVFWAAPFVGAILGGLLFRLVGGQRGGVALPRFAGGSSRSGAAVKKES